MNGRKTHLVKDAKKENVILISKMLVNYLSYCLYKFVLNKYI